MQTTGEVTSVRLELEIKKVLTKFAKEDDLTITQVIRKAIREYIQRRQATARKAARIGPMGYDPDARRSR